MLYTNTNEREEYKKCEIILGRDSVLVFVCVDVITHFFRESPILAIYASLVERVCTRLVIGSFQVRTFSWCVHLVSFFSLLSFEFALLLRHSIPPPHYHHYHHHPHLHHLITFHITLCSFLLIRPTYAQLLFVMTQSVIVKHMY